MGDENSLAGTTKAHKHSVLASDGGFLDEGVTGITGGSVGEILTNDGTDIPVWSANTANPLIKVTKTFADITALEIELYTLAEDSVLQNVFTDITTIFDVSTGVTIGDAGNEDGFVQSADFTSGTGLTSATRGAYITNWQGMRSTSGNTVIKAYGFSTTGGSGSVFSQTNTDNQEELYATTARTEVCQLYQAGQVLIGEDVCKASWFIRDTASSATGSLKAYIRQSDGTQVAISTTVLDASTITGSYVEYTFEFPATTMVADYMICLNSDAMTGGSVEVQSYNANIANGLMYLNESGVYVLKTNRSVTGTITYNCTPVVGDTQGEVDFYLQVVD